MSFKNFILAVASSALLTGCGGIIRVNLGCQAELTQVINNNLPFGGDLVAYGKKFGEISPKETLVDQRCPSVLGQNQVPVVLLLRDANNQAIGVVPRILEMGSYAQSNEWTINWGDVIWLVRPPTPLLPAVEPPSRAIKIPTEWFSGTTWKQFVNVRRDPIRIFVNGRLEAVLRSGDVFAYPVQVVYPGIRVQQTLVSVRGQNGAARFEIWPQNEGVGASQEVIGPYSLH